MKKNITINLFGQLYAIDEDAYELLKKYEDNMRSYFRSRDGGDDIADDIEHRVAELFAELKAQGVEAVTIEHVEEIIHRIGNPEQMEDEGGEQAAADDGKNDGGEEKKPRKRWWEGRKLFRDPEDAMLGGVMSGLCHYFGGYDPLFWRLGMVLLFVCTLIPTGGGSLFPVFAYIVLWILVPQAVTAEDRLRMRGKPVNTYTLNEEIMKGVNRAKEIANNPTVRRKAHGCLGSLIAFIVGLGKLLLLLATGGTFFLLLLFFLGVFASPLSGPAYFIQVFDPFDTDFVNMVESMPGLTWEAWGLGIAALAVVCIPFYLLIRAFFGQGDKSLSTKTRFTLATCWIAAAALACALLVGIAVQLHTAKERYKREANTRNGIYLSKYSWDMLDREGWDLVEMKGCRPYMEGTCADVVSGYDRSYVSAEWSRSNGKGMALRLQRTVEAEPGFYCVEALATANGRGGFAYVSLPGQREPLLTEIPVTALDDSGNIKYISWKDSRKTAFFSTVRDSARWDSIRNAGRGWNYLRSKAFRHPGGKLSYGIACGDVFGKGTNKQRWSGNELDLLDMTLTRVDSIPEK